MTHRTNQLAATLVMLWIATLTTIAAQPKPTRVPPPGLAITEKDRAELRAGTDALAKEIAALRATKRSELLPDVEIFHKAVDWAPVFIFPNPLNPSRYVVVNSGFTFAAAGLGSNAQQTPKLPDYAVLDLEHGDAVVLAAFFDEQWRVK